MNKMKLTKLLGSAAMIAFAASNVQAAEKWCQDIQGGVFCAEPEAKVPNFCGTKEINFALADGFADNPWFQLSKANAISEASRCPNVKSFTHTNGQGNTQKAISDLQALTAKGVDAIVTFPNAGPVMLPAIREAFQQGIVIIPFRARVGGTEGQDYTAFVGTKFYDHGKLWGEWLGKALNGKGNMAYLGGPAGTSESIEKADGLKDALKPYPGIEWIGQQPFEVTNWDPSLITKVTTALISRYPKIDSLTADVPIPILSSNAFPRAGRELPLIAAEDANGFGCEWEKLKAEKGKASFDFTTVSSEHWNVRLAVRWAIAEAAGGKIDEPLVITDTKGEKHTVAQPGDKLATDFVMDNSLEGKVFCDPELPPAASNSSGLTKKQILAVLSGG